MADATLEVTSMALAGGTVPREFTCDGQDRIPPFAWSDPPPGTKSFAIVVHDPDAPRGDFVHWVAWNLPPEMQSADPATPSRGIQGRNDFGKLGWGGPCPPRGHGPHRYVFEVVALDRTLDLARGETRASLEAAMRGHVLARGELVATYERAAP